jgi:hypothetical protein
MEMSDELHVLAMLASGKSIKYPLDWRQAGFSAGKEKHSSLPPRFLTPII